MKHKSHISRRALSLLLALVLCLGLAPAALAGQVDGYHDPAEHWLTANNRTNELDANATVTRETFTCGECGKPTSFEAFRTPEYTRDGQTAMSRNVKYSDGTMVDGEGKGTILDGTPGVDAYYTGYHFTKAVCENCGTINSNMGKSDYGYGKNVYWLYDCAAEFTEALPETVTYEYTDSRYHTKTTTGGSYCCFCYGTSHEKSSVLERHTLETDILPQPANGRFAIVEHCTLCEYSRYEYVTAKAVIADYYGVVDGQPHTLTVTDLSESGVRTSIRYGNSADACTLTSAPNYTEEGQYTVYYEITYTYDGESMTENGVAYVWLRDEAPSEDGSCGCGCGDPDCGCQDKNCGGSCCGQPCDGHNFILLDSTPASCLTLGYDRYLCTECGKIEKRDYEAALGHAWQGILLRERPPVRRAASCWSSAPAAGRPRPPTPPRGSTSIIPIPWRPPAPAPAIPSGSARYAGIVISRTSPRRCPTTTRPIPPRPPVRRAARPSTSATAAAPASSPTTPPRWAIAGTREPPLPGPPAPARA